MQSRCEIDRLITRIERINEYLVRTGSEFEELIESLKLKREELNTAKPVVKIVSPSATLANNFKKKNLANFQVRSLYEFQATAPIGKIQQIIQHCDLICFIYYFKHSVSKQHQKLIELARQNNISLILLVRQPDRNTQDVSFSSWLKAQNCSLDGVQLPFDNFIDLNQQQIDIYQQLLWRSHESLENRFIARHEQDLKTLIEVFYNCKIASLGPEKPPHYYRQQLEKIFNRTRPEKQQLATRIKQNINYLRLDLLNPFTTESLIFTVRQIIDLAEIKVVREAQITYLYLTVNNLVKDRYIHDYVIELCQQKAEEIIAFQWSQIEYVSEDGLNSLIDRINSELKTINILVNVEDDFLRLPQQQHPSLNLAEFIELDCLKANSRIVFDYNFTQSSWFRLLISVVVGLGIYFITWMFLGSGKYIGFVIIIFQIINLILTGGQPPESIYDKKYDRRS